MSWLLFTKQKRFYGNNILENAREAKIQSFYHVRMSFSRLRERGIIICIIIADKAKQMLEFMALLLFTWLLPNDNRFLFACWEMFMIFYHL